MTVLHFAAFYYCWTPKHVAFAYMKAIRDCWWQAAEGAAHFSFQFVVFCCHTHFIFHNTTFTFMPIIRTLGLNLFLVSLSLFILNLVMISLTFSFSSFPFHAGVFTDTKPLISFFSYDCPENRCKLWKYSCETVASYQMDRTIFVVGRLSFDKP